MGLVSDILSFIQKKAWNSKIVCKKLSTIQNSKETFSKTQFVTLLVKTALNQDQNALNILKNFSKFNIDVQDEKCLTTLHHLAKSNHQDEMAAILFMLKNNASFSEKNEQLQTPFHFLVRFGTPDLIVAFWENRKIWEHLLEMQDRFDTADNQGKKPAHYLMEREPDKKLNLVIASYYPFRDVKSPDQAGNTPLHYAAMSGDEDRVSIFILEIIEGCRQTNSNLCCVVNHAGQTPADCAQEKGYFSTAAILYKKEFYYTGIYQYLKTYFEKQQKQVSSAEIVSHYREKILGEIERLSCTIKIPASELDDTIVHIFEQLEIEFNEVIEGYELPIHEEALSKIGKKSARELYNLTPIGKLEEMLRSQIVDELTRYVKSDTGLIKDREEQHDKNYEATWEHYHEEVRQFDENLEDGNVNYDYDGPIEPQKPTIKRFNKNLARNQITEEFPETVLSDIGELLKRIETDVGDMLYNHFITMDLIENVLEEANFRDLGLDHAVASAILRRIDFQFPDIDIAKPGFLVEIFRINLERFLEKAFYKFEIEKLINAVFENFSDEPKLVIMAKEFNEACNVGDVLNQQKLWLGMHSFVVRVFKKESLKDKKQLVTLSEQLAREKKKAKSLEHFKTLIKVFPTNDSEKLIYSDEKGSLFGAEIELPLKPIFKALYSVAKATQELIVKKSKKDDGKTNVVTAMLSFVVSRKTWVNSTKKEVKSFVNIPLTLDYSGILLSRDPNDGVFKDEDDFERSISKDRQQGGDIVGKIPAIDVPSKSLEVKKTICRLLDSYSIPKEMREKFEAELENAEVAAPLSLEYSGLKDVQKSTLFFHSERVIFHALKQPNNVEMILNFLKEILLKTDQVQHPFDIKYTLCSASLILYSYPNSVCNECGLGFVALQNSYENGFLKLLIEKANQSDSIFNTVGFDSATGTQVGNPLPMTVVVGSYNIFSTDSSGNFLKTDPDAKLDFDAFGPVYSKHGIDVGARDSAKRKKFFYEFAESTIHESKTQISFSGKIAMSGSKTKKIPSVSSVGLDKEVTKIIEEQNKLASSSNVLSFSKGHQVPPVPIEASIQEKKKIVAKKK